MIASIGYLFLILIELIFAFFACVYAVSALYSSFMGSAYVPTRNKDLEAILKTARLKKGQVFMDLGSGDGRVVKMAVKKYGVHGIGIDINPTLIFIANLKNKFEKIKNLEFQRKNIKDADFKKADIIYIFLMPNFIAQLTPILRKKMKKNALVISHGFKIIGWQKYTVKTIQSHPFPTYFYRL